MRAERSPTLREIVERLGGELIGDRATPHRRDRAARDGDADDDRLPRQSALRASSSRDARGRLRDRRAGVPRRGRGARRGDRRADPYLYFARLTQWWAARTRPAPPPASIRAPSSTPARASAPTSAIGAVRRRRGRRASIGDGAVDRRARLRRRDCRDRRGDAGSPARRRCSSDCTHRRALHRPRRRRIGADGFGFAPDERPLGEDPAARPRASSATTSRSAPTPASTAARSTTP